MKVTDFTYFLEHPTKVVEPIHTKHLEDIIEEYPYFQAARALHLKGLKNLNSYKYNKALKITAAYTADRDVLFDFITSNDFLQNSTIPANKKDIDLLIHDKVKNDPVPLIIESEDKPLPQDENDADQILDPELFLSKKAKSQEKEDLALGTPLQFDAKEKFSFSEWLNLASQKPIERDLESKEIKEEKSQKSNAKNLSFKKEKFDRIDKFIANNPKIAPTPQNQPAIDISSSEKINQKELMTETLARVYLEQKKYKKAIQAYKILSLKYPEKSGFFADRIKSVEKIKKENT